MSLPDTTPDYSRQKRLRGIGEAGQSRLAASTVLIIGAGGLGSAVIPLLAGAGVGKLTIVDYDHLEVSNLHRQTFYRMSQVGKPKAQLAADEVRKLNPAVEVQAINHKLAPQELLDLVTGHDLVVECTDDFANKLMVNDAAVLLKTPAVFANAVQREGQLQSWTAEADSACLRCLWPEVPANTMTCEQTGVLGSVPAVIGSLQATEALQLLLQGDPEFFYQPLKNRVLIYDMATYQQRLMKLPQSVDCGLHSENYTREQFLQEHQMMEYTGTFKNALAEGYTVVDIRDSATAAQQPLPVPCLNVAADQLLSHPDIDLEEPVLLVCYMGRTSLSVTAQLRNMGYEKVFSKANGAQSE